MESDWLDRLPAELRRRLLDDPQRALSGMDARAVVDAGRTLRKVPWLGSDPRPVYTLTPDDVESLRGARGEPIAS